RAACSKGARRPGGARGRPGSGRILFQAGVQELERRRRRREGGKSSGDAETPAQKASAGKHVLGLRPPALRGILPATYALACHCGVLGAPKSLGSKGFRRRGAADTRRRDSLEGGGLLRTRPEHHRLPRRAPVPEE